MTTSSEYMKRYRRRQRSEVIKNTMSPSEVVEDLLTAQDRIRELEKEARKANKDTGLGR